VKLEDKATVHIDGVMKKMWNTTFVELFGPRAANVTVNHLLRMQSGLSDFDKPDYEDRVLLNETIHDPLEDLKEVANYTGDFGCTELDTCTWMFNPGEHTAYSSLNYLLAGLVVMAHAPED